MNSGVFIWKSDLPSFCAAQKPTLPASIRILLGADWWLEEQDGVSKSYEIVSQEVVPNEPRVLFQSVKKMPTDWVGAELFEMKEVQYYCIKKSSTIIWEQVGQWQRIAVVCDNMSCIEEVWLLLKKWMALDHSPAWLEEQIENICMPRTQRKMRTTGNSCEHRVQHIQRQSQSRPPKIDIIVIQNSEKTSIPLLCSNNKGTASTVTAPHQSKNTRNYRRVQ